MPIGKAVPIEHSCGIVRPTRGERQGDAELFGKYLMYERDGNRSFADGGCYSFDVSAANIADSEDAGETGFQEIGRTLNGPFGFRQIFRREIWAGLDKPSFIARYTTIKPRRIRHRARHGKEMGYVMRLSLSSLIISPGDARKMIVSFQRHDLGVAMKFYVRRLLDAPD
jgi:hypothetical protein